MAQLNIFLHNTNKPHVAYFYIKNNQLSDDVATSAVERLCLAAIEMAQDDMLFDLSALPIDFQRTIAAIIQKLDHKRLVKLSPNVPTTHSAA